MTERVPRRVRIHVVETHMIVNAAVDADGALEPIRFLIDWPIAFVAKMILALHRPGAWQHCAAETALCDDASELGHGFGRFLQGNQAEGLKARALAEILVLHPAIVRAG